MQRDPLAWRQEWSGKRSVATPKTRQIWRFVICSSEAGRGLFVVRLPARTGYAFRSIMRAAGFDRFCRPPPCTRDVAVSTAILVIAGVSIFSGAQVRALPDDALPAGTSRAADAGAEIDRLWAEGEAFERREALLESARIYERIAAEVPESPFVRWRISRDYWRHADRLPRDDKNGRMHYFRLAEDWADRSLALDVKCGECVLWKLASMGRLATTSGVMHSMGMAAPIAEMIERGIKLEPTHDDGRMNVSLANLYYAGAAFYRIVPDWFWMNWVVGVRGDKERSLKYIRKALEMSDPRVDYQVEFGAVLLCLGHDQHDPRRIEEGRAALREAMTIPHFQSTDAVDIENARILMEQPERACGYSRDGWINLDEAKAH